MHELKFFIKPWKKYQRLLQKQSHVKRKKMEASIKNTITVSLKNLVSFLEIEEVDL